VRCAPPPAPSFCAPASAESHRGPHRTEAGGAGGGARPCQAVRPGRAILHGRHREHRVAQSVRSDATGTRGDARSGQRRGLCMAISRDAHTLHRTTMHWCACCRACSPPSTVGALFSSPSEFPRTLIGARKLTRAGRGRGHSAGRVPRVHPAAAVCAARHRGGPVHRVRARSCVRARPGMAF
jgi:hypothetical protein